MSLFRSSLWAASAAVFLAVSRFVLGAILARKLPADEFGLFAYSQWLVDIGFLVCSLGVPGAASRYFAEYRDAPEMASAFYARWRRYAIGLPMLASVAALVGGWLSQIELTGFGLAFLALWTLCNGLWAMQTAALVGLQRFDLVLAANAVFVVVVVGLVLLVPSRWLSTETIFLMFVIASACSALVGLSVTRALVSSDAKAAAMPMLAMRGYALNIWIATLLASLVWSRGEFPVVRRMLGDAAVAHYAVALTMFSAAVQGVMLGVSGVAPHLTRLWGQGFKDEAVALARAIMDMQLLVAATGSLVVVFLGETLVSLVFTDQYKGVAQYLAVLCLGLVGFAVSSQTQLLQLETNARFNRNTIVFGLAVLYMGAIALIPAVGLLGAAFARACAMLGMGLVTVFFCARRWGWRSVSIANVIVMLAILGAGMAVKEWLGYSGVGFRGLVLSTLLVALVLGIRTREGGMVLMLMLGRLSDGVLRAARRDHA